MMKVTVEVPDDEIAAVLDRIIKARVIDAAEALARGAEIQSAIAVAAQEMVASAVLEVRTNPEMASLTFQRLQVVFKVAILDAAKEFMKSVEGKSITQEVLRGIVSNNAGISTPLHRWLGDQPDKTGE